MPELTIVVPLIDSIDAFESTLASVLRFSHQDLQIVGLHDGNYEDQYGIGAEVELLEVGEFSRGRSKKTVFGSIAMALGDLKSPWIHWLSPGIEPFGDCYSQFFQTIDQSDRIGLLSPQILPHLTDEEASTDDTECLASALIASYGYHPQYLEEAVGDYWTLDDLDPNLSVVGPTYWAGFCKRDLFAQWVQQMPKEIHYSDGYRELAFGYFLAQEKWQHQFVPCNLIASESTEEKIRQNIPRSGKIAADLLAKYHTGSAVGKVVTNTAASVMEFGQSIFSPGGMVASVSRLLATGALLARKPKKKRASLEPDWEDEVTIELPSGSGQEFEDYNRRAA